MKQSCCPLDHKKHLVPTQGGGTMVFIIFLAEAKEHQLTLSKGGVFPTSPGRTLWGVVRGLQILEKNAAWMNKTSSEPPINCICFCFTSIGDTGDVKKNRAQNLIMCDRWEESGLILVDLFTKQPNKWCFPYEILCAGMDRPDRLWALFGSRGLEHDRKEQWEFLEGMNGTKNIHCIACFIGFVLF